MRMRGFVWAAAGAFLLKVALALLTVGTSDSLTWSHDLDKLRTQGFAQLYREGVRFSSPFGWTYQQPFIHPPAIVNALYGGGILEDAFGLPLRFWLRLACALADIGTLIVIWRMFGHVGNGCLLIWIAISPISILVSGFHANTDPIMVFFLIAAVYFVERRRIGWAGAMFGLAASIKLVPLIFVPAILLNLTGFHQRIKWAGIAAATWVAASMPYLAHEPILVLKTILGYDSNRGLWGFYMLTRMLEDTPLGVVHNVYAPAAKWIALLAVALLPALLKIFRINLSLFVQCGMIVFLFLFLSPGFGLQYLSWTVPWLVVLGVAPMGTYFAVAGACMLFAYCQSSAGTGTNAYADMVNLGAPVRASINLIHWLAIGAMTWLYAKRALRNDSFAEREK